MPYLALILLTIWLTGCGTFGRDSTLLLGDSQLEVRPQWAVATGALPEFAHAQLPPAAADGQVYVASVPGKVRALDTASGALQWETPLRETLSGGPGVGAGLVLVATPRAELIALDRRDGVLRWRSGICSEMLATPLVAGDRIIVQCIDGHVLALRSTDGRRIWSYHRLPPALTLRGTSTPQVAGERVIAGFADGKLVSLSLNTGELEWEATVALPHGRTDLERMVDIDGRFQVVEGVVYVCSYQGRIAALSVDDGRFLWAREMSSYAGLAVAGDRVFVTDTAGLVWALDSRTGATLWRQDGFTARTLSSPAVLGATVAVADERGDIHWLDAADGRILATQNIAAAWAYFHYQWEDEDGDAPRPDHAVSAYPVVSGERLIVRDNTGALIAFRIQPSKHPS